MSQDRTPAKRAIALNAKKNGDGQSCEGLKKPNPIDLRPRTNPDGLETMQQSALTAEVVGWRASSNPVRSTDSNSDPVIGCRRYRWSIFRIDSCWSYGKNPRP